MNIKDLQPGSYKVISRAHQTQPVATAAPKNVKDLVPGSYTVVKKAAPTATPPKTKTGDFFNGFKGMEEVGKGVVKGVIKDVQSFKLPGIQNPLFGGPRKSPVGNVQYSNPDQKIGGALETIGTLAIGGESAEGQEAIKGATDAVKPVLEKTKTLGNVLALGKEGVANLERLANEETQKFIKGKTFSETEDLVTKAVKQFKTESKNALQAVKSKLPSDLSIKGGASEVATRVNQAITSTFEKGAEFKGVIERTFKSPQDLINKGLLNPEEAKVVKGMMKTVSEWGDSSVRGILNLKEQLDSFYKVGANNANLVLRNIQRNLKDLVDESVPIENAVKPALAKATADISKAEDFVRTLTGKTAQQGESKILQIARNLKDPARNSETLKLIQELETATGKKIMPELKGIYDYLKLARNESGEILTKGETILKKAATRTGIAGGVTAAGLEVKNLFSK